MFLIDNKTKQACYEQTHVKKECILLLLRRNISLSELNNFRD